MSSCKGSLGAEVEQLLTPAQRFAARLLIGAVFALIFAFVAAVLIGVVALYRWAL